jgi:hypothetical protein
LRVSGAARTFSHDNLSIVNVPRRCCRPGCPHYAVATLTFVYSDSTAVIGPLATAHEPHSWDLCVSHAGRITAGREGRDGAAGGGPVNGFHDSSAPYNGATANGATAEAPATGVLTSAAARPAGNGRRRGHLRVLPDPAE